MRCAHAHPYASPRTEIQRAFDAVADLYAANDVDLNLYTREQCENVLLTRYGPDESAKLIEDARIQARVYCPDFLAYLEHTGAGNAPSAIFLLAMSKRGELGYTPEEASKKRAELRSSGDFSKAKIDLGRVLTRLAHPPKVPRQSIYYRVSPRTITSRRAALWVGRHQHFANRAHTGL